MQLFRRGDEILSTLYDSTGVPLSRFVRLECSVTADDLCEGIEHVDDARAF